MSDSPDDIPDFATPPTFADLAADPEIAPLLGFDPVTRKVKRPDGWTADLQRELIARLAATGTLQQAVWQMDKHATGAEALYKVPSAISFRAAWDEAVAIGRRRQGLDCGSPHLGPVPGITRRSRSGGPASMVTPSEPDPDPEADGLDEDGKLELIENVLRKHMLKVALEREARLKGEIVAADFYLRQISWFEVAMDLISGHGAAFRYLHEFHCGERRLTDIAETPMSRLLDERRREYWAAEGEPARPEHPPRRFLEDHGAYSLEPVEFLRGGDISHEDQKQAFAEQHAADAAAQVAWEAASAIAATEWRARQPSDPPRAKRGEGDHPREDGDGGGVNRPKPKPKKRKPK